MYFCFCFLVLVYIFDISFIKKISEKLIKVAYRPIKYVPMTLKTKGFICENLTIFGKIMHLVLVVLQEIKD